MPLTFLDIERKKSWHIWIFFLLLLALYLSITALFAAAVLHAPGQNTPRFWITAGFIALLFATAHFWFSAYDTVSTLIRTLDAQPPDEKDDIHAMLANVMQEIHVVTGNKVKIQSVVIPSLSLNALAAADLKGQAVIGITEGLLSRLSRPQLESVIAHEAHHILSGDCLETTIASSLFGAYADTLEKLSVTSRGRSFLSPPLLLAWVLLKLSLFLNMFISREREYRADAASVRMTRNPIALAETLYLLSRSWRGAGFIGSGLEALCIVNPEAALLDETEGAWADLVSTHPPISKRIAILLGMAHTTVAELEERWSRKTASEAGPRIISEKVYYAMNPDQTWVGPFTHVELASQPWLSPLTWIMHGNDQPAVRAWKDPVVNEVFAARLGIDGQTSSDVSCPSCRMPLVSASYDGTSVRQCRFCGGLLVEIAKVPRILARTAREQPCSERILQLARATAEENQLNNSRRRLSTAAKAAIPLTPCPQCKNPMYRGFYSMAHMIEIDRCSFCGLIWFDKDELTMLQCLVENRIVPGMNHASGISSRGF